MINEVGLPYTLFIGLLYLMVAIDFISLIFVFRKDKADRVEFCSVGIKWYKVICGLLIAVLIIYMLMTQEFSAYVMWIQLILSVLLLVIEGANLIIKIRYGKKRKR